MYVVWNGIELRTTSMIFRMLCAILFWLNKKLVHAFVKDGSRDRTEVGDGAVAVEMMMMMRSR